MDNTGRHYEGMWENNKCHGYGTYTFENGDVYKGMYVDGNKHGNGKLTMTSKDLIYDGEWANGAQNGEGTIYTANDLKEIMKGTFVNGQMKQEH